MRRSVAAGWGLPVAVAVAASVAVRARMTGFGMTRDEAATLYCVRLPLVRLVEVAGVQDLVLLPYYLVMRVWVQLLQPLPWSELACLRAASLVGYAVAVGCVTRAAARHVPWWAAVAGAAVVAAHPLLVTAGATARPYGLAAGAAGAAMVAMTGGSRRDGRRFAAAGTAIALLQPLAAMPAVAAAGAAALRRRPLVPRWALLPPAGASLALLVAASAQRGQLSWVPALTASSGTDTFLAVFGRSRFGGAPQAALLLALALLAVRSGARWQPVVPAAAWLLAPPLAIVCASVVVPMHLPRYLTTSALGLGLVTALLLGAARRRARPAAACLAALLALANALSSAGPQVTVLSDGFEQLQPMCASADVVALPNHMAEAAFAAAAAGRPTWPRSSERRLEAFSLRLDDDVLARLDGRSVAVCDFVSPYDRGGVDRLTAELRAAGYREVRASRARSSFVVVYAPAPSTEAATLRASSRVTDAV